MAGSIAARASSAWITPASLIAFSSAIEALRSIASASAKSAISLTSLSPIGSSSGTPWPP